jgi:hypothetical protein
VNARCLLEVSKGLAHPFFCSFLDSARSHFKNPLTVLRQAQHERRNITFSGAHPFALSRSKGERRVLK